MEAEEQTRERAQRPAGEIAHRLGAEMALSALDLRIENQRVLNTTPGAAPTGKTQLTQMEEDIATKARVRVLNTSSVVITPGVYQDTASQVSSGPSELSLTEKDTANKASVRSTRSTTPGVAMTPGAYQVSISEPTGAPASASGAPPENSDAAIKARERDRGATNTPSELSQAEADIAAKTRRTRAPRVSGAGPGVPANMTAFEADIEAKSRGRTRAAPITLGVRKDSSAVTQASASEVVVSKVSHVDSSEPSVALTSSSTSAPGAVAMTPVEIMSLEEQITYKTGIPLDDNEIQQEPSSSLNKFQDSFRLSTQSKQGSKQGNLQDDLDMLENSLKEIKTPHGGYSDGGRDSGGINGAGRAFDHQEHLAVAVAIEEEDDDKFLASAVEYDPDSKPPIHKNRRFRMYGGLIAIVLLVSILLGVVLGLVLGGDDSKTTDSEKDDATSAPTTYRESLGIQEKIEKVVGSDKLFDPSNSQYRALQWILHEDPNALEAEDPSLVQRFLLVQFYLETSQQGPWRSCGRAGEGEEPSFCLYKDHNVVTGDIRSVPSNRWLSEQDECMWSGVECNGLNQVTQIELAHQDMAGTLPTELVLLPFLQLIHFPFNRFTGNLPREWGEMNHLMNIGVHSNMLTGTIPDTWWDLSNTMTGLNVGHNRLVGSIPGDRFGGMHNLRSLFIDENLFTGAIPTEVGLLTDLRNTRWNNNFFSGTLPTEFGQLKKLKEFWFHRLLLSGTIPFEIAESTSFTDFRVHFTGIEGTIPDGLYQNSQLRRVDLFGTKMGGTISTEIGNISLLSTFRISDCQFYGTVPTEMGLLANLQVVWLEGNDFSGDIPSEVCDLRGLNDLEVFVADCANTESTGFPAVTCESGCCTSCCDTESSICDQ